MRTVLVFLLLLFCCNAADRDRSDASIEEQIRARFAKSKIAANGFKVHVQRGVATLTGTTDVIQHKGVATRLAKSGGAAQVVNNIQVSQAARDKAAAKLSKVRKNSHAAATPSAAAQQHPQASPAKAPPASAAAPSAAPATPGSVPPPVRRAQVKAR